MISRHLLSPGKFSCHLWVGSGQLANRSSCVTGPGTEAKEQRPLSTPPPHRSSLPHTQWQQEAKFTSGKVVFRTQTTPVPCPCGPEPQSALRNFRLSSQLPDRQCFENEFKASKRILPPCLGGGRSDLSGPEGVQAEVRAASPLKDILKRGSAVKRGGGALPPARPVGPRCAMITAHEAQEPASLRGTSALPCGPRQSNCGPSEAKTSSARPRP